MARGRGGGEVTAGKRDHGGAEIAGTAVSDRDRAHGIAVERRRGGRRDILYLERGGVVHRRDGDCLDRGAEVVVRAIVVDREQHLTGQCRRESGLVDVGDRLQGRREDRRVDVDTRQGQGAGGRVEAGAGDHASGRVVVVRKNVFALDIVLGDLHRRADDGRPVGDGQGRVDRLRRLALGVLQAGRRGGHDRARVRREVVHREGTDDGSAVHGVTVAHADGDRGRVARIGRT